VTAHRVARRGTITQNLRLPAPIVDNWAWQRYGRCVGAPSEVFFPEDAGRGQRRSREAQAKLLCRGCPVLAACRQHALRTPEMHGVWGAMSASERAHLQSRTSRVEESRGLPTGLYERVPGEG
jgi:WhiB family transcriptional regulator, redox-sensing transcriptional regulator